MQTQTLNKTQLAQFAVNARCSPGRILSNHTEDQGANLFADTLLSSYLAESGDPRPIQTKSRSLPVYDGSRSDQDERLPPPGPAHSQRNPEQFVQGSQSTARSLRVQSQQLPTESQVFEDEVHPATERTDQPAQEMSERHDHGKNFSGKDRIKLYAKSFISQVYDLWRGTAYWNARIQDRSTLRGFRCEEKSSAFGHGLAIIYGMRRFLLILLCMTRVSLAQESPSGKMAGRSDGSSFP